MVGRQRPFTFGRCKPLSQIGVVVVVGACVGVGVGAGVGVGVGGPLQIFVDCEMVASFPPLHWYFNLSFLSST